MKTLFQHTTDQREIVQPSVWKREYELRTADTILCTMKFPKWYSTSATIEGFGETVELQKPSIWKWSFEIRKEHNQLAFAKFIPEKWGRGGTFELPGGERIEYRTNFWKGIHEIYSQQKIKIVSFKRQSIFKTSLSVTIEHESAILEKYPWIIMAVYYQMLQQRQHTHSAM